MFFFKNGIRKVFINLRIMKNQLLITTTITTL